MRLSALPRADSEASQTELALAVKHACTDASFHQHDSASVNGGRAIGELCYGLHPVAELVLELQPPIGLCFSPGAWWNGPAKNRKNVDKVVDKLWLSLADLLRFISFAAVVNMTHYVGGKTFHLILTNCSLRASETQVFSRH